MIRDYYNNLLSASIVYGIGSILEKSIVFLLIPLYTYFLSPHEYGIIALLTMTLNILQVFALTPSQSGLLRYYYAPEFKGMEKILFFNAFIAVFLQSIALALLMFLGRNWIAIFILKDQRLSNIVIIYAAALLTRPLSSYITDFLRLREQVKAYVSISVSRFALSIALIIFLMVKLDMRLSAVAFGELFLGVYPLIVLSISLLKHITFRLSLNMMKSIYQFGTPFILSGLSNNLIQWSDRYILRIFTSITMVGIYSLGYQFSTILHFGFVTPVKQAIQPIILKLEKNPEDQKLFISRTCTYFLVIGTGLWLFLSINAKWGISIIARDESYHMSWIIVPILTFSYLMHGLGNFLSWGMIMKKRSLYMSGILAFAALINIILNLLFIPLWGIVGAAFATLVCYFIWNLLKAYYSMKFYDLRFEVGRLMHILAVGTALYGFSFVSMETFSLGLGIIIKSLLFIAYPFILLLTGFFNQDEKIYIKKIVNSLLVTYTPRFRRFIKWKSISNK